jgi:type 1 glutamine amidotransferase
MKHLTVLLSAILFAQAVSAGGDESGFKPLFNGKDLSGWEGDPRFWSVRDGTITGQTTEANPTDKNTFVIWREGEADDFILRFSYRMVGGNSGVQYRSHEVEKWVLSGYQGDYESGDNYSGINYEEKGRGILAQRGQRTRIDPDGKVEVIEQFAESAALQAEIKKEDWNDYEVIAKGNHLIHKINGQVMSEVTDDQAEKRAFSGLLGFQVHAGPPMLVQVKDIRLKRLPLEGRKKIVLIAGVASHGAGAHAFPDGVKLLRGCLDQVPSVQAADYYEGWPSDPTAFDNADTIMFFLDGGGGHPAIQGDRLEQLGKLMEKGIGMACIHYAVEVPKDRGGKEFLEWIGGYYETGFSTNPHWEAKIEANSDHPIARGVKPFKLNDEWYYNMRFRPDMKGVTPILSAIPPDETRGTESAKANPGRAEILAWATEREDGGRGFGFTGGHFHIAWRDENFRRVVLNALLWTAQVEVPEDGVVSVIGEQ